MKSIDQLRGDVRKCYDAIFLSFQDNDPVKTAASTWASIIDDCYSGELVIFQHELFLLEQVYRMYFCQLSPTFQRSTL